MSSCVFYRCERIAEHAGYCFLHKQYSSVPAPAKVKVAIAKVSEKRKVVNREYDNIKKEILGADNLCKIKSPACTGIAQGLNHTVKRSPSNLTKRSNLVASCNPCNNFLESNSKWALTNGHTISKFRP